jgi:hypothetical protein
MHPWLRRLIYALLLIVWFILITSPFLAFVLAARGQIQLGEGPRRYVRLFLVQEEDTQGIGVEWVRPAADRPACSDGSLTYFTWQGEGQNAHFCQCYDPAGDQLTSVTQQACSAQSENP